MTNHDNPTRAHLRAALHDLCPADETAWPCETQLPVAKAPQPGTSVKKTGLKSETSDLIQMNIYDIWTSMTYEHLWTSMNIYEHLWTSMNIYEHLWTSMNIYEHLWTNIYEHLWTSTNIYEHQKQLNVYETSYFLRPWWIFRSFLCGNPSTVEDSLEAPIFGPALDAWTQNPISPKTGSLVAEPPPWKILVGIVMFQTTN